MNRAHHNPTHLLMALLTLLVGALTLSACPQEITCADTGCPFNQVCDPDSGACRLAGSDCREDPEICGEDELCNERTGQCFSRGVPCGPGLPQCPRAQVCDAERGFCELEGRCLNDSDCAQGEACDVTLGECAALPCAQDDQCPREFVCELGRCQPGCLPEEPRCLPGRFCRNRDGEATGTCASECTVDTECVNGSRCALEAAPAQCVPEGPCEADADCRADEGCVDNQCVATPCLADSDCVGAEVCDLATGVCIGGDCVEDTFSPNHAYTAAAAVEPGALTNLALCPRRPDWYALELVAGELVEVTVEHRLSDDLDLHLFDSNLRLLRADEGLGVSAKVRYQARRDDRVLLRVASVGDQEASYELSVERTAALACDDDAFEQNDFAREAREVNPTPQSPVNLPLTVCFDDEDWFVLRDLSSEQGLTIRASPEEDLTLDVSLYTPDGATLPVGPDGLSLARLGASGDYFVRARSLLGAAGDYGLVMAPTDGLICPSQSTTGGVEDAIALPAPDQESVHVLCTAGDDWEIDWYAVPPVAETGVVTVRFDSAPDLELTVTLFELEEEGVTRLLRTSTPGQPTVAAQVTPTQDLRLRVTSPRLPGRLVENPTYTLEWAVE
jgi:hypothetical protein